MSRKLIFIVMGLLLSLCVASVELSHALIYQMTEQNWAAGDFGGRDFGDYSYIKAVMLPPPFGPASGLVLNPEGKGDLLIGSYFDIRPLNGKAQTNLLVLINETTNLGVAQTGDQGVVAKLRFHEWDKSEEIFDCDIWLSDADVWIAEIRINAATGIGNIWSPDWVVYDYTFSIPPSTVDYFVLKKLLDNAGAGYDFLLDNITGKAFPGVYPPPGWTAAQMTHVGYFEVIGEERTKTKVDTTFPDRVYRLTTGTTAFSQYPDCPNTLMGSLLIVRVDDGVAMGYNLTAIANFSRRRGSLFVSPGALTPRLDSAEDTLSMLEFALSAQDVMADYSIEPFINAKASIILTFPTKWFRYAATHPRARIVRTDNPFRAAAANAGEIVTINIWDRDENRITPDKGWWSPPPTIPPLSLPYEVNICGMYPGTSPVVGGYGDRNNVAFPAGVFTSGWVWIYFYDPNAAIDDQYKGARPVDTYVFRYFRSWFGGVTFPPNTISNAETNGYNGLPGIWLKLQEFQNLTIGQGAYYGEINPAWYEVDWQQWWP